MDSLTRLAVAGTCFEYGLQDGELNESSDMRPVTQYGLAKHFDCMGRSLRLRTMARLIWTGAVSFTCLDRVRHLARCTAS